MSDQPVSKRRRTDDMESSQQISNMVATPEHSIIRLFIVRHGQASFGEENYDQLSPLGKEQSRRMGKYFTDRGVIFDQVFVGPRLRHRQTCDAVTAVYHECGLPLPEPIEVIGLDEHCGAKVLKHALPRLSEHDEEIKSLVAAAQSSNAASQSEYVQVFQKVTRIWARGELESFGYESWQEFRTRVQVMLAWVAGSFPALQTMIAFTSAGAVSATVGYTLGLNDEQTIEASWRVRNAALTEIVFRNTNPSLVRFNSVPHLTDPVMITER